MNLNIFYLILLFCLFNAVLTAKQRCVNSEGQYGYCQSPSKRCETLNNIEDGERCNTGIFSPRTICCPDADSNNDNNNPVGPSFNSSIGCGVNPTAEFFIVGGEEATEHSRPWATAVYVDEGRGKGFICGGAVLNERYIMTAAHCVTRGSSVRPAKQFIVKVGAHRLSNSGTFKRVAKVKMHENYDINSHHDDIALFQLQDAIDWKNDNAAPICLPDQEIDKRDLVGTTATLVGWGTTSEGGRVSDALMEVDVPIVSNAECRRSYSSLLSSDDQIGNKQICAGMKQGGKDTCQGDSGGPMTMAFNNIWYQIGIVSFGKGCAEAGYPGVYTRVSKFVNWIGQNMNDRNNG